MIEVRPAERTPTLFAQLMAARKRAAELRAAIPAIQRMPEGMRENVQKWYGEEITQEIRDVANRFTINSGIRDDDAYLLVQELIGE